MEPFGAILSFDRSNMLLVKNAPVQNAAVKIPLLVHLTGQNALNRKIWTGKYRIISGWAVRLEPFHHGFKLIDLFLNF